MPFGWGIVSTGKHPDVKIAPAMAAADGGGDRRRHRLLAQHVLAGFRRLDDGLGMHGVRRAHEDAVDT